MKNRYIYPGIFLLLILALWLAGCSQGGRHQEAGQSWLVPSQGLIQLTDSIFRDISKIKDKEATIKTIDSLLQFSPYEKDSAAYMRLILSKASLLVAIDSKDSAMPYLREAATYLDHHPEYIRQRIVCFEKMGYTYLALGDQTSCAYWLNKAGVEMSTVNPDTLFSTVKLINFYHSLAGVNRINQLYEQAHRYILLAIYYAKRLNDTSFLLKGYNEAFVIYMESGKTDSARFFLKQVNTLSRQFADNINVQLNRLNRNAYYFYTLQQWDSTLKYCLETVAIQDTTADPSVSAVDRAEEYNNVGEVLTFLRRLKPAKMYLDKALATFAKDNSTTTDDKLKLSENTLHYYIVAGDVNKAEKLLGDYVKSSRSYFDAERSRVINEMEAKYKLKEKEKHIVQLDTENKAVADKLRAKNLLLLISILVILLAGTFVVLLAVILRQRRISSAKEKVELEQRLLRSQMEPHFIFNTLSVLQHIIRSDQKDKAIRYLRNFAGLLRLSLENSRESLVPLADEVKALENYLSLQELRFEEKFSYRLEVYEGYEEDELLIPPMLLQPFVENAIEHGLRGVDGKGLIQVSIRRLEGVLECIIEDNGTGLSNVQVPRNKRSLSTTITRERLEILGKKTGRPASVVVSDKQTMEHAGGTGTYVRLIIPFQ